MSQNQMLPRLVKALLVFHGHKQKTVAKKYGISEAHFSEMLTGTRRFKQEVLVNVLHDLEMYTWAKEQGLI